MSGTRVRTLLHGHMELLSMLTNQVGPQATLYSYVRLVAGPSDWARPWLCSVIKQRCMLCPMAGLCLRLCSGLLRATVQAFGNMAMLNIWAGLQALLSV